MLLYAFDGAPQYYKLVENQKRMIFDWNLKSLKKVCRFNFAEICRIRNSPTPSVVPIISNYYWISYKFCTFSSPENSVHFTVLGIYWKCTKCLPYKNFNPPLMIGQCCPFIWVSVPPVRVPPKSHFWANKLRWLSRNFGAALPPLFTCLCFLLIYFPVLKYSFLAF